MRQGGFLSPFLYNFCIDSLSTALNGTDVCCHYMGSMNHAAHADDTLLISPSPFGLQTLLNTCDKFEKENDNTILIRKRLYALTPKNVQNMSAPRFTLCGSTLSYVNEYKYLGFFMSDDASDNTEIQHQYRKLCCRTNSLIGKFSMSSYSF